MDVKGDSQLVIRQLEGEYRVKAPNLRPLYEEARSLLREFDSYSLQHIRRNENTYADRLVNDAMNEAQR